MESPSIGKMSSMYAYAWKSGLKTTYYLRSRPATRINKTTSSPSSSTTPPPRPTGGGTEAPAPVDAFGRSGAGGTVAAPGPVDTAEPDDATSTYTDAEAIACSLENPESCEACQ
jgi:ribonucleoside-diphosphate reductase alpha chain